MCWVLHTIQRTSLTFLTNAVCVSVALTDRPWPCVSLCLLRERASLALLRTVDLVGLPQLVSLIYIYIYIIYVYIYACMYMYIYILFVCILNFPWQIYSRSSIGLYINRCWNPAWLAPNRWLWIPIAAPDKSVPSVHHQRLKHIWCVWFQMASLA